MLRWLCGEIKKDKLRNKRIRELLEVTSMDGKLRGLV